MKKLGIIPYLVALSFFEVAMTILLTKYFGALQTYAVFAVPTIIGLFIQWRRRHLMKAAWERLQSRMKAIEEIEDEEEKKQAKKQAPFLSSEWVEIFAFWITTFLLMVPGPLTALVAFFLMSKWGASLVDSYWRNSMEKGKEKLKEAPPSDEA